MAEKKARRATSQAEAVEKIREGETFSVNLPVLGQVEIPRPEQLAYYGGLAALAAFELIDWPVAVVIAAGHLLASNHHNRLLEELGEAIEDVKRATRVPQPACWIRGARGSLASGRSNKFNKTRERTASALRGRLGAVDRTNLTG